MVLATHTRMLCILLSEMVEAGCKYCLLPSQHDTQGLDFNIVFTNISRDHLDYYKTYDAYIQPKFFDDLSSRL